MILTELFCPFPSAINPSAELIHQGIHDWVLHVAPTADNQQVTQVAWPTLQGSPHGQIQTLSVTPSNLSPTGMHRCSVVMISARYSAYANRIH
jgi:hypothetical protein